VLVNGDADKEVDDLELSPEGEEDEGVSEEVARIGEGDLLKAGRTKDGDDLVDDVTPERNGKKREGERMRDIGEPSLFLKENESDPEGKWNERNPPKCAFELSTSKQFDDPSGHEGEAVFRGLLCRSIFCFMERSCVDFSEP